LILLLSTVRQLIHRSTIYPKYPKKILIIHSLLLGDTLLLTQLLAKLRHQYPEAEIKLTVPGPLLPLYKNCPYHVTPIHFNPKRPDHLLMILKSGPYDLVIIPAENRFSLLARASGAAHIVAFSDDHPAWKNWMIDTPIKIPSHPTAIGDIFSTLIPGNPPEKFNTLDWTVPSSIDTMKLKDNAVIMHVTSSVMTKMWSHSSWLELAHKISSINLTPYWSIAPGEEHVIQLIDPTNIYPTIALPFSPMWHTLKQAVLLVSVDTSIVHLARLTGTPTVTLFGPTDPILFGSDTFLSDIPSEYISNEPVQCRDDNNLYRRPISWINICTRNIDKCPTPHCIQNISVSDVFSRLKVMIEEKTG